jgi:hypothetical protein
MPLPRTYTSVLAVPRSIPRSRLNAPNIELSGLNPTGISLAVLRPCCWAARRNHSLIGPLCAIIAHLPEAQN